MDRQRRQRLAKLVSVLQRVKAVHEARHASHTVDAAAAEKEARNIATMLDAAEPMSSIFPELYHRRIDGALARSRSSAEKAQREAQNILAADARANAVARAYREVSELDDRDRADKERLEFITRNLAQNGQ